MNKYDVANFLFKLICAIDPLCKIHMGNLRRKYPHTNFTIYADSTKCKDVIAALIQRGYIIDDKYLLFEKFRLLIDNYDDCFGISIFKD